MSADIQPAAAVEADDHVLATIHCPDCDSDITFKHHGEPDDLGTLETVLDMHRQIACGK
jgi:hypothetical protein